VAAMVAAETTVVAVVVAVFCRSENSPGPAGRLVGKGIVIKLTVSRVQLNGFTCHLWRYGAATAARGGSSWRPPWKRIRRPPCGSLVLSPKSVLSHAHPFLTWEYAGRSGASPIPPDCIGPPGPSGHRGRWICRSRPTSSFSPAIPLTREIILAVARVLKNHEPIIKKLVLTFSVVGSKTNGRRRDKQVVEPIMMIDPAIKLMNRRDVVLADFSPGTIRPEIMKQRPSPDLKLS
jgi:hypothetical protein